MYMFLCLLLAFPGMMIFSSYVVLRLLSILAVQAGSFQAGNIMISRINVVPAAELFVFFSCLMARESGLRRRLLINKHKPAAADDSLIPEVEVVTVLI